MTGPSLRFNLGSSNKDFDEPVCDGFSVLWSFRPRKTLAPDLRPSRHCHLMCLGSLPLQSHAPWCCREEGRGGHSRFSPTILSPPGSVERVEECPAASAVRGLRQPNYSHQPHSSIECLCDSYHTVHVTYGP